MKHIFNLVLCSLVDFSLFSLPLAGLINTFNCYGPLSVEWPGKDGKHPRCPPKGNMPKGNAVGRLFNSFQHFKGGLHQQ